MLCLTGGTRVAFLCFFASHIPITLFIDGQAALPHYIYPRIVQDLLDWYTGTFKDHLMSRPHDLWFTSIVTCELIFQVPFFFYAVYALSNPARVCGKGNFRSACIAYGAHTSTTLVPILTSIANDALLTTPEMLTLLGFYLPYLIFPFWLLVIAVTSDDVFQAKSKTKSS